MGLWYPKGSGFELTAFSDADHAGCVDTRKSTSGGIQFLGDKLVSWMSKKQDCTTMSSAEAEYVALSASCNNRIVLCQKLNPIGDMFTKALPEERFQYLVRRIGMRCLTPAELEGKMPTKTELTLEQSQQGVNNDVLKPTSITYAVRITMLIADIEDDIMDPVMQCTTLPSHSSFSQKKLVSFVTEIHSTTIDFLTPNVNKSRTHYPCDLDSARTFRVILFSIHNDEWKSFQCHHQTALRISYTLSWKPCQGDSLNLPDHRIHKDGDGDASFQLKSDSLPHAHAQSTKTFYKHQDSRIMKAQELKTKTSAQTLILTITPQKSSFGGDY
ncbi:hypothetical protein Tco_0872552 [Tanacetum coccineum]